MDTSNTSRARWTRVLGSWGGIALLCTTALAPAVAMASPWTMDKGRVALRLATDLQFARNEWLINGDYQEYPLDGQFFSVNLRGQARYGVTQAFELGANIALSHVSYQSEEIYFGQPLVPDYDEVQSNEEIAAGITSLDRETTGLSDLEFYGRVRLVPREIWRVAITPEVNVKVPTGYERPAGTFEDDDFTRGVADDVTLGDGQLDITARLNVGLIPHPRWFMRFDAGFRFRFFGPGQQVVGGFKTGVRIGAVVIPYVQVDAVHTVNEGKVVGTTFATSVPETPASAFTPGDLLPLEYRLDRSAIRPGAGVIIAMEKWEIDVSYTTVAWGRNISQLHIVGLGSTFKL